MEISERLLSTWKEYLTTCLKKNLGMHHILETLAEILRREINPVLNHYEIIKIDWVILDNDAKPVTSGPPVENAVPVEIRIFVSKDGEERNYVMLEWFQEHMLKEGIAILEKATFEIL